jgi:hypothetical protein
MESVMKSIQILEGVLRTSTIAVGLGAGAVCAYTAYHNGLAMAPGDAGQWFGYGFLAIVGGSWLMWPIASFMAYLGNKSWAFGLKAAWVIAMLFVTGNSIMYTAYHRSETVEGRGQVMERYDDARKAKDAYLEEIQLLKKNPVWERSMSCTRRARGSWRLCKRKAELDRLIAAKDVILQAGKPGSKDAGAETLAWVLSGDASKVGRAWPVYIAIMLELTASLFLKLALSPWDVAPKAGEKQKEETEEEPGTEEEPEALRRVKALVAENGGTLRISRRALAEKLGMRSSTVHDKLTAWAKAGILDVKVVNRCTVIRLAA